MPSIEESFKDKFEKWMVLRGHIHRSNCGDYAQFKPQNVSDKPNASVLVFVRQLDEVLKT